MPLDPLEVPAPPVASLVVPASPSSVVPPPVASEAFPAVAVAGLCRVESPEQPAKQANRRAANAAVQKTDSARRARAR
jgi:hypothetical protein